MSQELCPSPRLSVGTGFAPPRVGSRPRLPPRGYGARGRGLRAWGRGKGKTTTPEAVGAESTGNYNSQQGEGSCRGGCRESGASLLFSRGLGTAIDPVPL